MMTDIADEIAILEQSSTDALRAEWRGRLTTEPPSHASDEYMRSVLAFGFVNTIIDGPAGVDRADGPLDTMN